MEGAACPSTPRVSDCSQEGLPVGCPGFPSKCHCKAQRYALVLCAHCDSHHLCRALHTPSLPLHQRKVCFQQGKFRAGPKGVRGLGEYLQAEEEEEDDRFACPCPQPCLLLIRPVSPSHHCLRPLSDRQAVSPAPRQQSGPLSPPSATTGLRHGLSLPQIPQRLSQQRNMGFTFSS